MSYGFFFPGTLPAAAQTKNPGPSPTPEKRVKEAPSEDRIYSAKEVDVKAKITRLWEQPPSPGTDCPRRMRLFVAVHAVLRRSGDVTQVELIKESGCDSYDKDVMKVVRTVKFTPALKDGLPVSQHQRFEFEHRRF